MKPLIERMPFKAAIFDLDGTLVDSMGVWEEVDRVFLERRGFTMDPSYSQALKTMRFEEAAYYTIERYALKESPEAIMAEWDEMARSAYETEVKCKSGVKRYLQQLKAKGIKLAVASVSTLPMVMAALKGNGIEHLFEVVVDVAQVVHGKDEPDLYYLAAEKLQLPPEECMVFEDALLGVRTAKKAGFKACGVWDAASKADEVIMRDVADGYITDFAAEADAMGGYCEEIR